MRQALLRFLSNVLVLVVGPIATACEQDKNYVLTIDGREVGIDLGDSLEVEAGGGQKVKIGLRRAEQITFRGAFLSFAHRGDLAVSTSKLDKDLTQHLLASGNGTVIIVQEYAGLDPTSLLELMLTTITQESIAAGGKMSKSGTTREAGGRQIQGLKAEVVNGSDKMHVETYALGQSDKGVVIITQIADDYRDIDQALLDGFWKSLQLKL
jgi:hypothetical protein